MLAKNFDNRYLNSFEERYYENHFNADRSPKIVVYGTSWCPGSKKLREEPRASNVDFVEIDVEKTGEKEQILQTLGIGGYLIQPPGSAILGLTAWI